MVILAAGVGICRIFSRVATPIPSARPVAPSSGVIYTASHPACPRVVDAMAERPSSRTAAALSDDGADPGLTNRLGFSALTMEPPQQELQPLGRTVAGAFKKIIEAPWTDDSDTALPSRRRIAAEEQRFRLWARTLGLFQTGHASLDYRVRDASFVKASLADLLMELRDHLQNRQ